MWSFRSRQKPFVRRSSLQAHSLLLLLLSLSGGWCVKCALSFLALILKNIAPKMSCVFHPIAWLITLPWQKISFSHIYCTPSLYPFKDPISYSIFARAFFFGRWNFHRNCQFPFIDLTKLIMWCSHIYRYCALHLHCDPRKSSIFPIFLIETQCFPLPRLWDNGCAIFNIFWSFFNWIWWIPPRPL